MSFWQESEQILDAISKLNVEHRKGVDKWRLVDSLWKYCRKKIAGPGFLINQPVEVSPLAQPPVARVVNYSKMRYKEGKERLTIPDKPVTPRSAEAVKFTKQRETLLKGYRAWETLSCSEILGPR